MPNNVTNRVSVDKNLKEVLSFVKGEKTEFDFNKIIPMPEGTNITSDNLTSALDNKLSKNSTIKSLKEDIKRFDEDMLENFILGLRNFKKHGHATWYSWCCEFWGTKWNAYEVCVKESYINFDTAWAGVPEMIQKLSENFKDVLFTYEFADEDSGCNTGSFEIRNGIIEKEIRPKNQSNEAYELYIKLKGENSCLEKVNGMYRHKDCDTCDGCN